jgi:hypothetical protein
MADLGTGGGLTGGAQVEEYVLPLKKVERLVLKIKAVVLPVLRRQDKAVPSKGTHNTV